MRGLATFRALFSSSFARRHEGAKGVAQLVCRGLQTARGAFFRIASGDKPKPEIQHNIFASSRLRAKQNRPTSPHRRKRAFGFAALALPLLTSCASVIPNSGAGSPPPAATAPPGAAQPVSATPEPPLPATPPPAEAVTAAAAGVIAGPAFTDLGISAEQATAALRAFRLSCPSVQRRADTSGLTQNADWTESCNAATGWPDGDALAFFARHFAAVQIGTGTAFVTGYFEPEIAASRTRQPGYDVPVYRRPADLVDVDLGLFSDSLKGKKIRGRVDDGTLIPYYDRAAIVGGALAGRGLELAWAADAAEFFFLQIQGSGRLRMTDGSVMRIGYDAQNGRDYVGIGQLLLDRGELARGQASMQGILAYLHADPVRGAKVMNENPSWIFFREIVGPGPIGALGVPVTGRVSVAADPKFVPLGAPVVLSLDRAEPPRLWIAQDTGGAIKGANRFDSFWGAGVEARAIAGGMAARGSALLLLPRASVARLTTG